VRSLLLIMLAFLILPVSAQPRQSLVPGGIAIVQLKPDEASGYRFNGKPLLTTKIDGVFSAVVGLPLDLKAGEHYLEKSDSGSIQNKVLRGKPQALYDPIHHHRKQAQGQPLCQ
jgi:hypothetical protein